LFFFVFVVMVFDMVNYGVPCIDCLLFFYF